MTPQPRSRSYCDDVLKLLSKIQCEFVLDESRFKLARCPRRAGKTWVVAAEIIYTAFKYPQSPIVYFGLTKDSAKEAIWPILMLMLDRIGIKDVCDPKESTLSCKFPNGSTFSAYGIDMENMANRFRGRKFRKAFIDECAFYNKIGNIFSSVLLPATADLQGPIVITSSPGLVPKGLFYEADLGSQKESWSRHTWTIHDNPHFQQPSKNPKFKTLADEELALVLKMRFDGDRNHPTYRREYLGEWVFDAFSLVYPLKDERRIVEDYPIYKSEYAIGLNLAQPGKQGYVVLKYSDYVRTVQVVESGKLKCRNLDDLNDTIQDLRETYECDLVYTYLGDNPPEILDDFKSRYGLPLQADRHDKLEFYEDLIATDMQADHIEVVKSNVDLLGEFDSLVKSSSDYRKVETQDSLLADAFYVVYLNVYKSHLQTQEEKVSEEDEMEKELREHAIKEYEEMNEYRKDYW